MDLHPPKHRDWFGLQHTHINEEKLSKEYSANILDYAAALTTAVKNSFWGLLAWGNARRFRFLDQPICSKGATVAP
jgi:hypothetical protein